MPRLIVNPGTDSAWEIRLQPGVNTLGREADNQFQILHQSVSSSHCHVVVNEGSVTIKDLGSTNGTFINGSPVEEALLQPGQRIHLGSVELLLDGERGADSAPATNQKPRVRLATREDRASPPIEPAPSTQAQAPEAAYSLGTKLTIKSSEAKPPSARPMPSIPAPRAALPQRKPEKALKKYSDLVLLLRVIGFGGAAAFLGAAFWGGFTYYTQFDISFIFSWGLGALCGFAAKKGAQDSPGVIFSVIAVFWCLVGIALGKLGALLATHFYYFSVMGFIRDLIGVIAGCWSAWWIGGGDA